MRCISLQVMTMVALVAGLPTLASASPAIRPVDHSATAFGMNLEQIDYTWNHHHYHHRSWDKEHKRWHYYD